MKDLLTKKELLGVGITNESKENILEYMGDFLQNTKKQMMVVTPNPEILVYASHHKTFKEILNSAEISLPDGVGVVVASKFLGKSIKNRITGVDFMKNLCEMSAKKPITVGFLGGKPGVAQKASECLKREFLGMKILLVEAGNPDEETVKMIQQKVGKSQVIDILFVGFGFPKQEQWIHEHLEDLPVRVAMTVGGAFDIFSGSLQRAPSLMRKIGLEWLWRLILEPSRIKRQIKLVEFVYLVIKEKFSS